MRESQIYRIDHYLGKETVQNILAFRFANGIFEPIWNRRYVDHVQMTVAEEDGIGNRGAYYDKAGALRDIVQNHMFQLLTLVGMEPPISFAAEDVRDEKVKVLHAVTRADRERRSADNVVRAQYDGYRREPHVAAGLADRDVRRPAAHARQLAVGRRPLLPAHRQAPRAPAHRDRRCTSSARRSRSSARRRSSAPTRTCSGCGSSPKKASRSPSTPRCPGPLERLETVTMDFSYAAHFQREPSTGYETLLFDAMTGDQTLFHRMDIVEAGWQIVQPILRRLGARHGLAAADYAPGSWGPAEADSLLERDGRRWQSSPS